jgi:two-component system, response regulator PdtaR
VAQYLRSLGIAVVAAQNAQTALLEINSGQAIDLVFSDINMPGTMDGLQLAQWLTVHRPRLPVILTSAVNRRELTRPALRRRFLAKPYGLDALVDEIRDLLQA